MLRRSALAPAATLAILTSPALGLLPALAADAQAQVLHAAAPLPSFEVATIKPRDPNARLMMTPPGSQNTVRYAAPAKQLVAIAYNATEDMQHRVLGGPGWIDDQKSAYVIDGKIPDDLFARMQAMTGEERRQQACLMLQSLLADRFQLKVHFETREMPVYELTIAKNGPKLPPPIDPKPTTGPDGAPKTPQMGGGETIAPNGVRIRNMSLDGMLTAPWFGLNDRPIVNKTGLTETYNLTLNWIPNLSANAALSPAAAANMPAAPEGQPDIFTAVEEQLGLKLVSTKAPVEIIVIDNIDRPTEN